MDWISISTEAGAETALIALLSFAGLLRFPQHELMVRNLMLLITKYFNLSPRRTSDP